jgi:hypothetical protein
VRLILSISALIALVSLHLAAFSALLHPKVSREYRSYYIDQTSQDWRVKHYPSTPEEGIDLTKPGWPDFVAYSFGISRSDNLGSWTDTRRSLKAGFEFNQSFSGPMCVVFNAAPSKALLERRITIAFGDQRSQIQLGRDETVQQYAVEFELPRPTARLELLFPKRLPRVGHTDSRQLGIGLTKIRFFSQPCIAVQKLVQSGR